MKIFFSLSSKDKDIAEKIAKFLKYKGVGVWCYFWEMKGGDSLVDKINDGLENSDHLLLILSKNSIKSNWVKKELNAALMLEGEKKIKIIPLLLDDTIKEIPPLLKEKIYIDFRNDYEKGIRELMSALNLPSLADQAIYKGENEEERLLKPNEIIDDGKQKIVKRGDKLYYESKEHDIYSEITDHETLFKNKHLDVTWDNVEQKCNNLNINNLNEYKIEPPPDSDILKQEEIQVPNGSIHKYHCKFGVEIMISKNRKGELMGLKATGNCETQFDTKRKVVRFSVK